MYVEEFNAIDMIQGMTWFQNHSNTMLTRPSVFWASLFPQIAMHRLGLWNQGSVLL